VKAGGSPGGSLAGGCCRLRARAPSALRASGLCGLLSIPATCSGDKPSKERGGAGLKPGGNADRGGCRGGVVLLGPAGDTSSPGFGHCGTSWVPVPPGEAGGAMLAAADSAAEAAAAARATSFAAVAAASSKDSFSCCRRAVAAVLAMPSTLPISLSSSDSSLRTHSV
jgi:hypothetical protein